MFKSIFNFLFGWMKNDKAVARGIVQVMAAEAFSRNRGMAERIFPVLDDVLFFARRGDISAPSMVGVFVSKAMAKHGLSPEEILLVNLFLGSIQAQVADKKIPINNMEDVAEYVGWIREAAMLSSGVRL